MKVLVLLSLVALSAGSAIPSSRRIWAEESGILRFFGQNGKEIEVFQSPVNPGKVDVVIRSPFAPTRYLQIDNSIGQGQVSALSKIQNLVQLGAVNPSIYQVLRNLEAQELNSFGPIQQESPAQRFQLILQSINRQPLYQNFPWKQQQQRQGLFQRFAQNQQPQYNPGFERQQELQQIYQLESIPAQRQLLRLEQGAQQIRQLQQLGGYQQSAQQQPQQLRSLVQQEQLQGSAQQVQKIQQQQQLQKLVQQVQQQEQLQGLVQQVQRNEQSIERRQENRQLQRIGAQEWQEAEKLGQEAQQLERIGAQEWLQAGRLGQEVEQLREIENAEQQIGQGALQYWRGRQGYPVLFQRGQRFPQQQFGF